MEKLLPGMEETSNLEHNTNFVLNYQVPSLIVKPEKNEDTSAFQQEIDAYNSLQGTVIPTVLGQRSFCGRRELCLSDVDWMTLYEAAEVGMNEKTIETHPEEALYALWECKAEYNDENPCNF
ncbi:uncharacterized protein N7515_000147 [Penicillium bovifimosum]|uniref:Uncharacterized protein n=1 Tax=Penicillium bovifimosum TaxID=126998 RepID=A0A9W9LBA2_9EURO|nr:uncharacterized protein N7515_000147 [Penicillium bovifimosum]KAJ5145583.1 hypothetical protein N7515_000147 [Penicillium bovifimosum]